LAALSIKKITTLTGHRGSVYTLVADSKESFIFYSGSGDGTAVRWNLNDIDTATVVAKVSGNIFSLSLLAKKQILLLGQMQGGIHVLNIDKKKEQKHLAYHKNGIFDICLLNGENKFIAAGGDGCISLWNATNFSIIDNFKISQKSIRKIASHPYHEQMALACSDNNIYIVHGGNFKIEKSITFHNNSVFSVCYSPDGKYLLAGSRDAQLSIWDVDKNYELHKSIPAHLFTINSIAFRQDGKYFATASRDKTIKIWDAHNLELLKVIDKEKFDGHVNSVNKLLWLKYNDLLLSSSDDRSIMVWDIHENK